MVGGRWWSAFVLLGGCSGSVVSDYELTIVPKLLPDQERDVLDEHPEVKLLIVPPEGQGDLEVWYAGTASEGVQLSLPNLPPVPAGTRIGLIFERPGLETQTWHRAETLAYGEATVDEALATGEQKVTLEIVAPRVDAFSRAGRFDGADRKFCGAAAVLPDGRGFVFGGGDPESREVENLPGFGNVLIVSSDTVLELAPSEDGWSDAAPGPKVLPEVTFYEGAGTMAGTRRCALTATPIETGAGWRILLTGGRYTYAYSGFPTKHWCVWNPDTGACDEEGEMLFARSSHLALPLGANKVAVYGGLINGGVGGYVSFEVFNIGTRRMVFSEQSADLNPVGVTAGNYGAFGTRVGNDVIVCSGAMMTGLYHAEPSPLCFRIEPNESVTELEPMPTGVYGGSVAPLPDGGVLVTGGTAEVLDLDETTSLETVPATDVAYRYDPDRDSWTAVGPMLAPRAFHRSIPLGDGRVMLVGGVEEVGILYGATGEWIRCSEIFDPEANEFLVGECSDATAGQDLDLATNGRIWMALQGTQFDGFTTEGGGAVGIMGAIPELE